LAGSGYYLNSRFSSDADRKLFEDETMTKIIPTLIITTALTSSLVGSLQAKSYPRLDLQHCWNNVIDAGISDFDEVNNLCGMERQAVENEVLEAVRATTRITLDDALKKQIKKLSLRTAS
jgi:hypothetical protein